MTIPLYDTPAHCGFPSPAADSSEAPLDMNELLIEHRASTYCLQARGESMKDAAINDGDILVVDKSLVPRNGDIVIALYDDGFVVKRFVRKDGMIILRSENPDYDDVIIRQYDRFSIFGVVSAVVRKLR